MADIGITAMLAAAETDLRKAATNMELRQADVDRAQAAYGEAREQLARMEATCAWLRDRLPEVPAEEDAVVAEAAEPKPADVTKPASTPTGTIFGKPMPEVTNAQLALRALEQIGKPATTREVRQKIREFGHERDQEKVRGSLKYLAGRKDGLVENPEPGVWRLRKESTAVVLLNGSTRGA
jgi:hypothetical protein